jgi:hypothetical protein
VAAAVRERVQAGLAAAGAAADAVR